MADLTQTFPFTFQSAATATGNGTVANVGGLPMVAVQVTGINGDTITFEGSVDGTNYVSLMAANAATQVGGTTATANGVYLIATAGLSTLRCRISAYGTGSITVVGKGVEDASAPAISGGSGGPTSNVNVAQIAGTATTAGAGAVTAGTQRTTLASNDPAVTALEIIDDWDESDRAKVNPIVGQAGIAGNSGNVGATTTRTVLATDQPALTNFFPAAAALADALANPTTVVLEALAGLFNGTTWDRERNNNEVTVFASAARTTLQTSSDLTNYNAKGVIVTVDVTAIASSPSVTFTINYKDTLSGKYVALLSSAAIVGTGTTKLVVYPGVTVAANVAVSHPLPRVWNVTVAVGNADSMTYSVGANYIM